MQIGLPEYERTNSRYGDSQPSNTARYLNLQALLDEFVIDEQRVYIIYVCMHAYFVL